MSSNHSNLKDFVDQWRGKPGFRIEPTGNCSFEADVIYDHGGTSVSQRTNVIMIRNGYEDGKIRLDEVGRLDSATYHLDFTPDFQTYKYDKKSTSFVITGKSPKMGGAYTVTIQPT